MNSVSLTSIIIIKKKKKKTVGTSPFLPAKQYLHISLEN